MLTSASLAIAEPLLGAADRREARKEKLLNLRAIQLFLSTFQAFSQSLDHSSISPNPRPLGIFCSGASSEAVKGAILFWFILEQ